MPVVHQVEEAGRDRDRRVLGVAAGRERVGLGAVDDVQAGHRQAGPSGERCDDLAEARQLVGAELAGAVRLQGERVALPVDEDVHREREQQGNDHAVLPAEEAADEHEEPRERGKQREGFEGVGETEVHAGIGEWHAWQRVRQAGGRNRGSV